MGAIVYFKFVSTIHNMLNSFPSFGFNKESQNLLLFLLYVQLLGIRKNGDNAGKRIIP